MTEGARRHGEAGKRGKVQRGGERGEGREGGRDGERGGGREEEERLPPPSPTAALATFI